jgi:hypothetical protein
MGPFDMYLCVCVRLGKKWLSFITPPFFLFLFLVFSFFFLIPTACRSTVSSEPEGLLFFSQEKRRERQALLLPMRRKVAKTLEIIWTLVVRVGGTVFLFGCLQHWFPLPSPLDLQLTAIWLTVTSALAGCVTLLYLLEYRRSKTGRFWRRWICIRMSETLILLLFSIDLYQLAKRYQSQVLPDSGLDLGLVGLGWNPVPLFFVLPSEIYARLATWPWIGLGLCLMSGYQLMD